MTDLGKLRELLGAILDAINAAAIGITDDDFREDTYRKINKASALLAALDAKPEPPKPAERTAEEILGKIIYGCPLSPPPTELQIAALEVRRLFRELRAERDEWIRKHTIVVESYNKACDAAEAAEDERDALKARIEKAKARLLNLSPRPWHEAAEDAIRILSGEE